MAKTEEKTLEKQEVKLLKIELLQDLFLHENMKVYNRTKGNKLYKKGALIEVHPDYKTRLKPYCKLI